TGAKLERAAFGANPEQLELRLGLQRTVSSRFRVAAGATMQHNSPYGPFPAVAPYGERRLWQHVIQDQRLGPVALQHRYRIEERWVEHPQPAVDGVTAASDMTFSLRARYQLRATTPLGNAKAAHVPYAA